MSEARRITEQQGERLRALLAQHGEPTLEHVDVGEDGCTTEVERWGDVSTTTRRMPAPHRENGSRDAT